MFGAVNKKNYLRGENRKSEKETGELKQNVF